MKQAFKPNKHSTMPTLNKVLKESGKGINKYSKNSLVCLLGFSLKDKKFETEIGDENVNYPSNGFVKSNITRKEDIKTNTLPEKYK